MLRKLSVTMVIALTLFFAFTISAYSISDSVKFWTTNKCHDQHWSQSPDLYLRNAYDYGTSFPGYDCSVKGWAENKSGKLAYVYVYLRDQDGEVYSGTGTDLGGDREVVQRVGDDDYAQYGLIQCKLFDGAAVTAPLQHYLYMTVDDRDNK